MSDEDNKVVSLRGGGIPTDPEMLQKAMNDMGAAARLRFDHMKVYINAGFGRDEAFALMMNDIQENSFVGFEGGLE